MTRMIAGIVTLALFGLIDASEVQAQHLFRKSSARAGMAAPAGSNNMTPAPAARMYSYSYYTRSTLPARTYVGYGNNDFPYHGASYGHPYDPYTWSALSGSAYNDLARYYSPPLK